MLTGVLVIFSVLIVLVGLRAGWALWVEIEGKRWREFKR